MGRQLRFGIELIQNLPWQTYVEHARLMEEMGFDSIWVADHFTHPRHALSPWFDGWTLLPALATATSRIRLGALVTNIALHNPAMLARQALTVDHISGGRLDIGLGSGQSGDIGYGMIGEADWPNGERAARFREFVEIVDSMLRNEVTTYEGRYYRVKDAAMVPPPVQQPRPPFTIAALAPTMLRTTARYADTWSTYPGRGVRPEDGLATIRERNIMLDGFCAEIGRDPNEITRSVIAFGPSLASSPFVSVQSFEDFVEQYREAGMNEFIFYYPASEWYPQSPPEQDAVFERVVAEVIPRLRAEV